MKNTLPLFFLIMILALNACTPGSPIPNSEAPASTTPAGSDFFAPTIPPTSQPVLPTETQLPAQQTETEGWKSYSNPGFGLAFQYPSEWFGPEEYVSGQTLRVEVGSGPVYPYGTPLDQRSPAPNSYHIVVQYTLENQNPFYEDTYQSLFDMEDSESLSGPRNMLIRVRQLELGDFSGFEYISTLSESAQTEITYAREVILVDERNNLITISGSPDSVEVPQDIHWREAYQALDEANLEVFHKLLDTLAFE
jgi:hypothetical protein